MARALRPGSPRGLHAGGRGGPRTVLREHRPPRLRADEPAGGGQGGALRTLLPLREVGPPALPRRVPRRGRSAGRRRSGPRRHGRSGRRAGDAAAAAARARSRPAAGRAPLQPDPGRVRRRLRGPARRSAPCLRGHLQRRDQDRRAWPPDGLPRAVDPLRPAHRARGRQMAVRRAPGDRRPGAAVPLRHNARPGVRHLRPLDRPAAGVLPRTASAQGRSLGGGLPIRHPRQGARHAARPVARRHAVQRGRVRFRTGVRGAPAPHAGPRAGREPGAGRADAGGAPQGHPGVPGEGRPGGPRQAVARLPPPSQRRLAPFGRCVGQRGRGGRGR